MASMQQDQVLTPDANHSKSSQSSAGAADNYALAVILFVVIVLVMIVNFAFDLQRSNKARLRCKKMAWQDTLATLVAGLSFVASIILIFVGAGRNFISSTFLIVFVVFGVGSILSTILTTSTSIC